MKDQFAKLIDVKTIITFAIVGAVIGLAYNGRIDATKISDMALMIVSFFFAVKLSQGK